ncbi:MAG: N-acetylmuramoyl-L-alanine amidase [Bacteroidota bacterium]
MLLMFFRQFLLGLLLMGCLWAQNSVKYVTAEASPGEGVNQFLRAYRIKSPCNVNKFYALNSGVKKGGLKLGKTYKLPIQIYRYNGKSIRSTLGISDLPRAQRIQAYNEMMHLAGFRSHDFRKDKQLWVPHHFIHCPQERVVDLPETLNGKPIRGTYDIFGKDYAKVVQKDQKLKNKVFYVVGGHGGPDPGAIGKRGGRDLCEDEYAYDIALRLARILLEHGATVYLITRDPNDGIRNGEYLKCDKDERCWGDKPIPRGQKARLFQRSDAINALYMRHQKQGVTHQRMISLHIDSERSGQKTDVYFYYRLGDLTSKAFATHLRETFKQKYEEVRKNRGYEGSVTSRDLHMLRETLPISVFVELGNIRSYNDQQRLVLASNRQLLATWLYAGLLREATATKH